MQLNAGVPGDLVFIIQALVLFSIASEFLPVIQRSLPQNLGLGMLRRPSIVPVPAGMAMTELPDNENTNDNGTMQDSSTPEMSSVETDQDTAEISSNRSEKE